MLRQLEQKRKYFSVELGETYNPLFDLEGSELEQKQQKQLNILVEQAIKDISELTEKIIDRRKSSEQIVDEVNQLSTELLSTPKSTQGLQGRNERAIAIESMELKKSNSSLKEEVSVLKKELQVRNELLKQIMTTLLDSLPSKLQEKHLDTFADFLKKEEL